MGILAMLVNLFGCGKSPKPAQHTAEEICAVSISCGHMNHAYGYSFWIHSEDGKWLFDAECFTNGHEVETVFENRKISEEDTEKLLEILNNDLIAYAENYKKPKNSLYAVTDEAKYSFCMTFSDGSQYNTSECIGELEEFFYRLAEQIRDS